MEKKNLVQLLENIKKRIDTISENDINDLTFLCEKILNGENTDIDNQVVKYLSMGWFVYNCLQSDEKSENANENL